MKHLKHVAFFAALASFSGCLGQSGKDVPRFLGDPVITDSATTIFFPTLYNERLLSDNKIAFWRQYFANIVVYDIRRDSSFRLFPEDTYIESFGSAREYMNGLERPAGARNMTADWVFFRVKSHNHNGNNRIDEGDPSILYAVGVNGKGLRALTAPDENVIAFNVLANQGFVLVKIQRDSDNDGTFRDSDKEFYYITISLKDLKPGGKIAL